MIGKIAERGSDVEGLLAYLFGPGRSDEHHDPHLVAGWRDPADLEPYLNASGEHDFRALTARLTTPVTAARHGATGYPEPVWHCVARAAPADPVLGDAEWADAAHEIMHRVGLAPRDQKDTAVRWVAVRHADDHIHLVATLARQDGRRPGLRNDRYQVQAACQELEARYRLTVLDSRDRTACRRPTRAETEQARRHGWDEEARLALRRAVLTAAAQSATAGDFLVRLDVLGVDVQQRIDDETGKAVGIAFASRRHRGAAAPLWFGGGSIAPDLTWPKLLHRWPAEHVQPEHESGGQAGTTGNGLEEISAAITGAISSLDSNAGTISPHVADIAWATSDLLHTAAHHWRYDGLRLAAEIYDRASRSPYGRIPEPSGEGRRLRAAARSIANIDHVPGPALWSILSGIGELAAAVGAVRQQQTRPTQAMAAGLAARHVHAAAGAAADGVPSKELVRDRSPDQADSAVRLARGDFPATPVRPGTPAPAAPPSRAGPPRRRGRPPRAPGL